jgi:hypothetical protein
VVAGHVTDTDQAGTPHATVRFSLLGGVGAPRRAVCRRPRVTGRISSTAPIDSTFTPALNLAAMASDGGTPPLTALAEVQVTMVPVNGPAPRWTPPAPPGRRVRGRRGVADRAGGGGAVDATDPDGNSSSVVYTLDHASSSAVSTTFAIDPASGVVSGVVRPPDRIAVTEYRLALTATNTGGAAAGATLTVTVLDINDSPPTSPAAAGCERGVLYGAAPAVLGPGRRRHDPRRRRDCPGRLPDPAPRPVWLGINHSAPTACGSGAMARCSTPRPRTGTPGTAAATAATWRPFGRSTGCGTPLGAPRVLLGRH